MSTELILVRTLRGLEADDDEGRQVLRAWKIGQRRKCEVKFERSYGRLKWQWGLCKLVAEADERWPTKEAVDFTLKMGLGIFEERMILAAGEWVHYRQAGSIAYGNMEEPEFIAFQSRCTQFVSEKMLGCASSDLLDRLEDYISGGRDVR